MKIREVIQQLEILAPKSLQENYDNSGLIVGKTDWELEGVLSCLDSTEEVIEEAISKNCNLIIAHHPILFSGIKQLRGDNYIERTLIKAIKNDLCIYAIHTNLDNVLGGVNKALASQLNLKNCRILSPKQNLLKKLVFFCPLSATEKVRQAIFQAGAGKIGEYDCCAFQLEGTGSFRAGEKTNPHLGEKGQLHFEKELRVETVLPNYIEDSVIHAMLAAHPYEEVAYDLYELSMPWKSVGSGLLGDLPEEIAVLDLLDLLKEKLNVSCIRHTKIIQEKIQKVALCGGSGSFLLPMAKAAKADIFITADFKYHQFFDAEDQLLIADVGHYESEQFTPKLLADYLKQKISGLSPHVSSINTNPVHYR